MRISEKADYVRAQPQSREHTCHWPGCTQQVPPAMWGCKKHWFTLPAHLRYAIWRSYKPGQEQTGKATHAYVEAAKQARTWIRTYQG